MKKARQIVIPEDRPLTWEEFYDFQEHAKNSSIWYTTEFIRSEHQVAEKLVAKGYTRDDVDYIDDDGVEQSANIIDEIIEYLKDNLMVSDETYAKSLITRYSDSKRGANYIRQKLTAKGISSDIADKLIEESYDEERTFESLDTLAEYYVQTSTYLREENAFKQKQKLMAHLMGKGFTFDDIRNWEDQKEE